ncbi:hypothetical protein [Gordonia sp. KTR9]|uniref:hypothetical protein n=1 Tax=Gordonia sp. KTR9 TaxID=337191 RepID=UPI001EE67004|nr:hypothetical protein [Gordonia sp. KTR9]
MAAVAVLGWQLVSTRDERDDLRAQAAGQARAEQVSLDYAVGAAKMKFDDLDSWRERLTKNTNSDLTKRLNAAADSMEQIVKPLQWVSTAEPIAAKTSSESDGIYKVNCFVAVNTKNSQSPDGIESTATYELTIDSRDNWIITDIGGVDSSLPKQAGPQDQLPPP